jgi:hypothetical protein
MKWAGHVKHELEKQRVEKYVYLETLGQGPREKPRQKGM